MGKTEIKLFQHRIMCYKMGLGWHTYSLLGGITENLIRTVTLE